MANSKVAYLSLALLFAACTNSPSNVHPEVHGHRGCRGLLPENTVPAFLKAAEMGCEWLEMDVVITGTGEVLVSHEPWMDHSICLTPQGDTISAAQERSFNIYHMSLAEIQDFDCGSKQRTGYPEQQAMSEQKPTLAQVVKAVEMASMEGGWGSVGYNIEIKSEPGLYDTFQPKPAPFATNVLATIDSLNISDRCVIQSFDPAVLEAVHTIDEDMPTALLVDNTDGLETNLARLSFKPTYYSPDMVLVDEALARGLREKDIELLVWTVNDIADMKRMMNFGANGIITDYPDRLIKLLEDE